VPFGSVPDDSGVGQILIATCTGLAKDHPKDHDEPLRETL
jgi:hypothetical protein